jgi:hypothetical protein
MRTLLTAPLAFFFITQPAICGLIGYMPVGRLFGQADAVVVATVRDSTAAGSTLTLDLVTTRTLKGPVDVGAAVPATLTSSNVTDGTRMGLRMGGSISPKVLIGTTGIWFLQQSGSEWLVLPLMTGDISTEGLYLGVPSGNLSPAFAYETSAAPRTKLIQEIGAAAQDPATALAVSHLEALRVFVDLGSDLAPILSQLISSPNLATRTMGLAGEIRLGTPSALSAVVSSDLTIFTIEGKSQLANAVCEYRNTDASGITALAALVGSQYSTI